MKKFTFKGVLDGFRSSVTSQGGANAVPGGGGKPSEEIVELLKPENFTVTKTFCHGFPYQPTSLAYDPSQKLLAIGTKHGCLRILGRPGVDIHARHDPEQGSVTHIHFIQNEGGLITATADDSLHLWDFRSGKKPSIVHSLKFQRERITCLQLPFQSKWLNVGTERGNVHVVNIDTFELSGYIVNWNKAIELSRKTHPGAIIALEENPLDPNKLLIAFDSGSLVLWDLRSKIAEARFSGSEPVHSISWHSDGKQFMCSHSDGSVSTWGVKAGARAVSTVWPHARTSKDGRPEPCNSIHKVVWKSSRTGDNFVIFSGGLTVDRTSTAGKTPSLSVIHGKTTTVLEMEHPVLDFVVLCEAQWESEVQDPYAIIVLLQQDIVVIDLLTPGYPCFENPYPMDIHESPVTSCIYVADCPGDLIPAFYSVGSKAVKKTGFSEREWPIDGGQWGSTSCSYAEIIITGHADGSLKFWDASSTTLQALYKLKTSKPFERLKRRRSNDQQSPEDDPFAVQQIVLCPESRYLAIAGASSQVILYKFRKHEHNSEIPVLEIPIVYEAECEFSFEKPELFCNVRVKSGVHKKGAGYQVEMVCLTPWVNGEPPGAITTVAVSSNYGLMAYGNENGLVIVDIIQRVSVLSCGTPDLYGVADPYSRGPPRSPNTSKRDEPDKSPTAADPQQMMGGAGSAESQSGGKSSSSSSTAKPAMDPVRRTKSQGSAKRSLTKCYSIAQQQAPPPPTNTTTTGGGGSEEQHSTPVPKSHLLLMSSRQYRSIGGGSSLSSSSNVTFLQHGGGGGGDSNEGSDKLDSGFTRSRSSSMSSLDNITSEAIQSLVFINCLSKRNEYSPLPTLWIGTSLGSVLLISLQLPPSGDARLADPVQTSPSGSVFRLRGSVLAMDFLDDKGSLILNGGVGWRDEGKVGGVDTPKLSSSTNQSPVQSIDCGSQFAVLVSEKQARVISLPSQNCLHKQNLVESSSSSSSGGPATFVVKASVTTVKDSPCLVCYVSSGHLQVYSLPSLKLLHDVDFVPLSDLSFQVSTKKGGIVDPMLSIWGQQLFVNEDATAIAKTFCLSAYGHGMYLSSPSEVQKFTISTDFFQIMDTMFGDLYLEREMPERPKEGFFTGLFGGGPKNFDREELFGETFSGKGAKSVAKHIPGTAGEHLQMRAGTAASEIGRAKMLAIERGEKLGALEDKTAKMSADAENFSSAAHQLMLKYKDKKWYQL